MEKNRHPQSILSFVFYTLVVLAVGVLVTQPWSTASAGYVDREKPANIPVSVGFAENTYQKICLSTGVGNEVCFPENACIGKCLVEPGTSGKAGNPANDLRKSFVDLLDSFTVRIMAVNGNLVGKNVEVCFNNPGVLYVYGLNVEDWSSPIEPSFNQEKGKYCALVNAGDLGVNAGLSFAYFKK